MRATGAVLAIIPFVCLACEHVNVSTGPPPSGSPSAPAAPTIIDRGLADTSCGGDAVFPDLTGGWAFMIETRDHRRGVDEVDQVEVGSRYGLARICQDVDRVTVEMLLCTYAQSPIRHDDGQCAAYLPLENLLIVLETQTMTGQLDRLGLGAELILRGWEERWGYVDDGDDERFDHDGDGASGATLVSDMAPSQVRHVRRTTRLSMSIEVIDDTQLAGDVTHTIEETTLDPDDFGGDVLGRRALDGAVRLVRVDGSAGTPTLDRDGDGVVRCAELGVLLGRALPSPAAGGACTR